MKFLRFTIVFLFSVTLSFGQIRLPRLISDGMVLQRDTEVKIWGWSSKNERISVYFLDRVYRTRANNSGNWYVTLNGLKPGGPYNMKISGKNTVLINNILIGDVWLCSGQSNMEMPMRRVQWVYEEEIAGSENNNIRSFTVPYQYDFSEPKADFNSGSWVSANPSTVLGFSATAYFFATELYQQNGVPVGLISASMGGSPAEAWMSEKALKNFPVYLNEAIKFRDTALIKEIESGDNLRYSQWHNKLRKKDEGFKNPESYWTKPNLNIMDWPVKQIPGYWSDVNPDITNGVVWFRKKINVPETLAGKAGKLILGRIVDADSVYINGSFVGSVSYQYPPRRYEIPASLLMPGENTIVVRVINTSGRGGFVYDKQYAIIIGNEVIDLSGEWQFKQGAEMEPLASQTFIRWKPLGLFNGMISPLLNYVIKGVIWYQGESNAGRAMEYRCLFPALISDWRTQFAQGDFPFLFVQLANYMESKAYPSESNWALLRESQAMTLSVKNTAMAVAIDIGEWNDIHPLNKKDVGKRLALAAQHTACFNKNVIHSGPVFQSMVVEGEKIILTFSETGSGLIARAADELKHFAIAGPDKKFVWAKARIIDKNRVIVWNTSIDKPVAVRYAWADNPKEANLFNIEGLPASPFRTDDWVLPFE